MLTYAKLSKGQKKLVDAFVEHRPELASAETINSKDMYHIWQEIYAKRATGGPKVGYPHWLSKNNQISRGVLSFPAPNAKGLSQKEIANLEKSKLKKIIETSEADDVQISDQDFLAELRASGIEV